MTEMDYQTALSLKKMKFIHQIVSEASLDSICSWLEMHEEAVMSLRYAVKKKN